MDPSPRPTDPPPAPPPRQTHAGCLLLAILLILLMGFAAVFWMIGVDEPVRETTPPPDPGSGPGQGASS